MSAQKMIDFLRWYANERMNSQLMDERRCILPSMVLDLSMAGLLGLQTERRYGGQELSHVDTARVLEQAAAIDANLAVSLVVHNAAGISPIRNFCSEDTKSSILPRLTTGGALGAIAVSEPALGTNIRAMTTTAVHQSGGGYLINGRKSLISFGAWAPHVNLFARFIDASGKDLGITAFLVPTNNPGWRPECEAMTLGLRAIPQHQIAIDNLMLPAQALMGEEGGGDVIVKAAFDAGRWMLGLVSLGAMKRCLQLSTRYAARRSVATGCLLDNGSTQRVLGEGVAATRAVQALTDLISERLDASLETPTELYLVCKIISAELAWQVIDSSVQVMGANGFMDTATVGRYFRDYRILRIFEGATEGITAYLGNLILKAPDRFLNKLMAYFPSSPTVQKFAELLTEITERAEACKSPQEKHRITAATGNLTSWAITISALTAQTIHRQDELDSHVLNWCDQQMRQRINEVRSINQPRGSFPSSALLLNHICGYIETIGDTEQMYEGERRALDPLLRRRSDPNL